MAQDMQSAGNVSAELDAMVCDLIGAFLDDLAAGENPGVVVAIEDAASNRYLAALDEDGEEACLEAATNFISEHKMGLKDEGLGRISRYAVKEGLKTILAGVDEIKNGHSIWIFPEGTRNRGEEGSMLEFKEGSLKMADKAGCPVVPVAIAHSADVLENHFPFIRRAAITIRFGEPIDLKSLPREQKKQAGAYTRTIIQAMLDDILKED